jgi:cell division protein FtsB
MEGQFYRKLQKKSLLKSLLKNLFKTKKRAVTVLGGTILVSFVLFNNRGVVARIRLEYERQEMIEKVRAAQEENKRLEAYLKALDGDKKTIEKVAREKYGMVREGETVYKVRRE